MKPKYEKPTAIPLGEVAQGTGQCSPGSSAMPGGSDPTHCSQGSIAQYECDSGGNAGQQCAPGGSTNHICSGGSNPYAGMYCAPGGFPTGICSGGSSPYNL